MPDRTGVLTTNDVRVLRLLVEHGPHTRHEIGAQLRYGLGAAPALRRIRPLLERGLIAASGATAWTTLTVTPAGARALQAADRAAYGRCAA